MALGLSDSLPKVQCLGLQGTSMLLEVLGKKLLSAPFHSSHERQSRVTSGCLISMVEGFPGGAVVESLPANAGDTGSSPGLGRSHMPRSN